VPFADLFLPYIWGEGASRAFAEWQRETTLPESGSQSMGWASLKPALRVLGVSESGIRRHKGGPRRARTVDPRIKSPLLYRLSYRPH
jgi:hypothetical protein